MLAPPQLTNVDPEIPSHFKRTPVSSSPTVFQGRASALENRDPLSLSIPNHLHHPFLKNQDPNLIQLDISTYLNQHNPNTNPKT